MVNTKAFEQLFHTHYESLCRQAKKYIANQDICEDIVQECFIKYWELSENKNSIDKPLSYLSVSIRNNCISYLRKRSFNYDIEEDSIQALIIEDETSEEIKKDSSPEEIIANALQLLPPKCREIFELSRIQHKSYKEIAKTLKISIKTVENQMGKAIRIMREFVKDNPHLFAFLILYFNLLF